MPNPWSNATLPTDDPAFPHGTAPGYARGKCRCDPCTEAQRAEWKRIKQRRVAGIAQRVPGTAAAAHARALMDRVSGANPKVIASAAGLRREVLYRILADPNTKIDRTSEKAILAVTVRMVVRDVARVPAGKARQVFHSLRAQGYSLTWILREMDYPNWETRENWPTFASRTHKYVTPERHRLLVAIATKVGDTTGPDRDTARRAAAAGWLPLRYYDAKGDLLPDAAPHAEADDESPRGREQHEVAALRRLAALRVTAFGHVSPDQGQKRFKTRIRPEHWERLHVRPKWDLTVEHLAIPPGGDRFWAIIRRHVDQMPVSWAVAGTSDWTVEDVDLDYHGQEAELALWTDLAHECGHDFARTCPRRDAERYEALLGVEPGTWEQWLVDQNPVPQPGTVSQLPTHRKPRLTLTPAARRSA